MKNKRFLIILLICVILVWGLIGVRIYQSFQNPQTFPKTNLIVKDKPIGIQDFVLIANYPDPFLGEIKPVKKVSLEQKLNSTIYQVKKEIHWPTIIFKGTISKKNSHIDYCMLVVNNKEVMLKTNDTIYGIVVRKIYKDSIRLEYSKVKKTIIK
jgi:hypothetical protein